MAQVWTQEKLSKEDPLHDVKEEMKHDSPRLKHVDVPKDTDAEKVQMQDVVKSEVPEAFVEELKTDEYMAQSVHNVGGTEEDFKEDDPMHDVKQEIESGGPKLKHVDTPDSPMSAPQDGDVVKSEVPEAFLEELKTDHDIVKVAQEGASEKLSDPSGDGVKVPQHDTNEFKVSPSAGITSRGVSGRGTPAYRISAHHGMRPGGPLSRDLKSETVGAEGGGDEGVSSSDANPEEASGISNEEKSATKVFTSRGIPARGTPTFRISAHHGMRPGGPLSRDLKSQASETDAGGQGVGADLSGEIKSKGPGLHTVPGRGGLSNSGPRRGGLARTGSGVPGEQKGGNSLARTGSGVPGGSLARTGSGVPGAKGGNDLKDFSSFLDSDDFKK